MKTKLLITLAHILFIGNLFAFQSSYSIKSGLPSNNVYSIKQDNKGYIWAATDKGVLRFDGNNFKLFTVDEGLATNDNFSMLIDSKDNIWLYSFRAISKIETNSISRVFGNIKNFYGQFLINSKDQIFFSVKETVHSFTGHNTYSNYLIKNDKVLKLFCDIPLIKKSESYCYYDNDVLKLIHYSPLNTDSTFSTIRFFNGSDCEISDRNSNEIKIPIQVGTFFPDFYLASSKHAITFSENLYCVHRNGKLMPSKFYPTKIKKNSSGAIFEYNKFLYLVFNKGIYSYNIDTDEWAPFLNTPKATSVLIDQEKNVWVSTMGDGIIKYSNLDLKSGQENIVKLSSEPIKKVTGFKNKTLWIANSKNEVKEIILNKEKYVPDLIDLRFLETNDKDLLYYGGSNAVYRNSRMFSDFGYKAIDLYKDSIALSSSFGCNFLHKEKLKSLRLPNNHQHLDVSGRMYAILLLDGKFYSGNQKGLYWGIPTFDKLNPICLDDENESISVNGIKNASDGSIWVSTEGNGVYVLKDDVVIHHFAKELLDLNIHSIKIDEKDRVWLATRKGVNLIKKEGNEYIISKYTSFHGLPDDYINDTYCYGDLLYVATDEGLVRVNLKDLETTNFHLPPPIYINSIKIINKDWKTLDLDSIPLLDFDQNSLNFEYTGISYKSREKISYEYRLLPILTEWRRTDNNSITFNNLKPDKYTFEVRAIDAIGTISKKPAVEEFIINKHFSQEWWFISLMVIFVLGIVVLILLIISSYRRKKLEEKNKVERLISELRLQSLQAQLNPHFVFNSLNAIQQFINIENKKAANDYLSKFARLMRLYLNGSDSQLITLEQELEVLKLYVSLEHLRFADKFEYSLKIEENLALDKYKVPAMLLQPHVENAIRHGLIPGDQDINKLEITVKSHQNGILCVIEDNGIGRAKSFEIKSKRLSNHRSMGNKISKERLEMIRALKLGNISEKITDLIDENMRPIGTKVEILIT